MNYASSKKDQRRRIAWNRLHDTTRDRSSAVVLYLAAASDLDRAHAIRRGFKDENLIAVEIDPLTVRQLRLLGVNVIPRPLIEVLAAWPIDKPVAGIFADLQCGLEVTVAQLLMLWRANPAFGRSMLYLNLQRGREHNGWVRQVCEMMRSVVPDWRKQSHGAVCERHRGCAAVYQELVHLVDAERARLGRLPTREEIAPLLLGWSRATDFYFLPPYRSNHVTMDGVCLFNRMDHHSSEALQVLVHRMSGGASLHARMMQQAFELKSIARTRRCISAALAVRTLKSQARTSTQATR